MGAFIKNRGNIKAFIKRVKQKYDHYLAKERYYDDLKRRRLFEHGERVKFPDKLDTSPMTERMVYWLNENAIIRLSFVYNEYYYLNRGLLKVPRSEVKLTKEAELVLKQKEEDIDKAFAEHGLLERIVVHKIKHFNTGWSKTFSLQ